MEYFSSEQENKQCITVLHLKEFFIANTSTAPKVITFLFMSHYPYHSKNKTEIILNRVYFNIMFWWNASKELNPALFEHYLCTQKQRERLCV